MTKRQKRQPGDPCPYCKIPLTHELLSAKLRAKAENALRSIAKARANGTVFGRPRYACDDQVLALRNKGYSYRDIAIELKICAGTVGRVLQAHGLNNRMSRVRPKPNYNATDGHRPWLGISEKKC